MRYMIWGFRCSACRRRKFYESNLALFVYKINELIAKEWREEGPEYQIMKVKYDLSGLKNLVKTDSIVFFPPWAFRIRTPAFSSRTDREF